MSIQGFVDSASSVPLFMGASQIKSVHIPAARLVDPSNPFVVVSDPDDVVDAHVGGNRAVTSDEFSTFLVGSSLVHAMDGWIYLSNAVEGLLSGEKSVAVHLAYYAELRSSIAFMATQGVAVLNHKHLHIQNSGTVLKCSKDAGTHSFAWDAINAFIGSSVRAKHDILKVFSFTGRNFQDWLNAIPHSSTLVADRIVEDWLRAWSFDVSLFKSDRNLRNEVSYRPKKLTDHSLVDVEDTLQKLTSFWNLLEPSSLEPFKMLDQYLLKKLFIKAHSDIQGILGSNLDFDLMLDATFATMRISLTPALRSFFKSPNDHMIFVSAGNNGIAAGGIDPLPVIARATLLLRLTTGLTSGVFGQAGITKSDLIFLTDPIGLNCGLWNPSSPNSYTDLWQEVGDAIGEITNWHSGRTSPCNFLELNNELAYELQHYKQFNRAAFWGLTI